MELSVQSISPKGINVSNGFAREAGYLDVVEVDRFCELDGATDRNKVLSLSDICITHVKIDTKRIIDFYMQGNQPLIEINFSISSDTIFCVEGLGKTFNLGPNQHNIIFHPDAAYHCRNHKGNNQELVSIMLAPTFFSKYIPHHQEFFPLLNSLEKNTVGLLSENNLPITAEMHILLKEIQESKSSCLFRRMFLEAKVTELLMLQMEQHFSRSSNQIIGLPVNKQEYERMQQAKQIIECNICNPCSLIDLAHQIGTNECSLKKAFKEIYGTTVYGYLTKVRMQEAKRLLIRGDMNVYEVALNMGYSDASNFIAAFKKYYGFTPGQIIKDK